MSDFSIALTSTLYLFNKNFSVTFAYLILLEGFKKKEK